MVGKLVYWTLATCVRLSEENHIQYMNIESENKWTIDDNIKFINFIRDGFMPHPITLHKHLNLKGEFMCIDGKQRLEALSLHYYLLYFLPYIKNVGV